MIKTFTTKHENERTPPSRLLGIILIVCCVAFAHETLGQVNDQKITLTLEDVTLGNALKEIERITNLKFAYSEAQLDLDQRIQLVVVDKPLRDVLNDLFGPRKIRYTVHEREQTITLKRIKDSRSSSIDTREGVGQYGITGKVTDGETPMPGVNVIIKGTTRGTSTDVSGAYAIDVSDNDVLVFSFIGYAVVEEQIRGRTVIDITLAEDARSLDEVVINAGYWKVTDRERTGNIGKVSSKDIDKQPVSNPIATLQGRIPGVEITQSSGVPGGNFKVRIRGTNSIANGNDPLYIIDGVPYVSNSMSFAETSIAILGNPSPEAGQGSSPLNSINPADIESIEVLKDADATAIYGSRGANGVILITTKKGQVGKTQVDVNFYTGIAKVPNKVGMLSVDQYLAIRHEAYNNDGFIPGEDAPDLTVWDTTRYTDWQRELIGGTARTTDAQFSISGGEKNTQFSVGAGYHRETTVFPGENSDQRISTHVNLVNTSPNEKLRTVLSLNYSGTTSDLVGRDLTEQAINLSPNAPALHNDDGSLSWTNWNVDFENPLAYLKRRYEGRVNNLMGNLMMAYTIVPGLELKSSFGYTSNTSDAISLKPLSSVDPATAAVSENSANFSGSKFRNWIVEPQLSWRKEVGPGKFDVLLGSTFLDQLSEGLAQSAFGFASEALMKNIAAASSRGVSTNYYSQYRYQAFFGRINYSLKGKYILNLTGRRDGSSRFGPGKQFANFGAIGAAWIFSDENLIKNKLTFISFGKLRVSYGTTGNDQLGDYKYLDAYTLSGSGLYQGRQGLAPARLSNPDFAWESNTKFETGLELGFLDNRILSTFSYYRNRSSNQLVGFPLPATAGFTSVQGNFPATVQNSGLEIELNTRNIDRGSFKWSTSFNLSIPRNVLVDFPNLDNFPAYANRYVVGEPLSITKRYYYTGIDPATGNYTFDDINEDGTYTIADQQSYRYIKQDYYGGMLNSFQYKGFQLDVLFQFVKQTSNAAFWGIPGAEAKNQGVSVLDRWQKEGDNTDIPRASILSGYESFLYSSSDESINDEASFLRCKNVALSYTVPKGWSEKIRLEQARIFFQAQNLFVVTNYEGLDPETGSGTLSPLRTITGGIHLTF